MSDMTTTTSDGGWQHWHQDGLLHREDGPAVIEPSGLQEWYLHGQLHREGGPAITRPDGYETWFLRGRPHRVDGPADTGPDGYEAWYLHGQLHRVDGPALADENGLLSWYRHGQRFGSKAEHQNAQALAQHGNYTLYRVSVPDKPVLYVAGCRRFTLQEARAHWCESNSNRPPFIEAMAKEI